MDKGQRATLPRLFAILLSAVFACASYVTNATAQVPGGPDVVFVVNGSVSSDNLFGVTPPQSQPISVTGANGGWSNVTVSYGASSSTSSGSLANGTLSGSATLLLDMTPQCFGLCSDIFAFGASVDIYVRGCHQGYTFTSSASGQVSVVHPQGCSGTWGPFGAARWNETGVGSQSSCASGTAPISESVGFSGVSSATTRTFPQYPGVLYSLATSRSLSGQVAHSDGSHLFDRFRPIQASVQASFNISVALASSSSPPNVSIEPPSCVLCSRAATLHGAASDPDQNPPGPGTGITSWQWDLADGVPSSASTPDATVSWAAPGTRPIALTVGDDECESVRATQSVDVRAPRAIVFNLVTTGTNEKRQMKSIAERCRDLLIEKGWDASIESASSVADLCGRLNDPCIKGLVICAHGGAKTCNRIAIQPAGSPPPYPSFRPTDLQACLASHGVSLEFLHLLACNNDVEEWKRVTGVPRVIDTASDRTPPTIKGCPGLMNGRDENTSAGWPRWYGGDPYDYPLACPAAQSPLRAQTAPGGPEPLAADSTCGTIMLCDSLGRCGNDLLPVTACAGTRSVPLGRITTCSSSEGMFAVKAWWPSACAETTDVQADLFSTVGTFEYEPIQSLLPRHLWVQTVGCGAAPADSMELTLGYTQGELDSAGVSAIQLAAFFRMNGSSGGSFTPMTLDSVARQVRVVVRGPGVLSLGRRVLVDAPDAPGGRLPARLEIGSIHPLPIVGEATVRFAVPRDGEYDLSAYDASGRRVARLWSGRAVTGWQAIRWSPRAGDAPVLPSGCYFLHLTGAGQARVQRVIVIR